jgi:hypothetical protein
MVETLLVNRPLTDDQTDRFLDVLAQRTRVLAATWLKASDRDRWFLFVVSDSQAPTVDYGDVLNAFESVGGDYLTGADTVLLNDSQSSLGRAVLKLAQRIPERKNRYWSDDDEFQIVGHIPTDRVRVSLRYRPDNATAAA